MVSFLQLKQIVGPTYFDRALAVFVKKTHQN
jgi:hypothetical protein